MAIVRLHVTQVTNPNINWHFDAYSIPANACTMLGGAEWNVGAVREAQALRQVIAAVTRNPDLDIGFVAQPRLSDLRSVLVDAAARAARPSARRKVDHDNAGFAESPGAIGVPPDIQLPRAEEELVDHLLTAPILAIERSLPRPESLGSLLAESSGGTVTTLGVVLAEAPAPWVILAFPAGMVLVAAARGGVGRVRRYFDRDVASRLRHLKALLDEELITEEDFDVRRQQVLDDNYGSA